MQIKTYFLFSYQKLVLPFWNSLYNLKVYLNSVTLIKKTNQFKRNQLIVNQISVICSLLTIRCIQLLYIYLKANLTIFWQQLFHDYSLFFNCPSSINILAFFFALQTLVFTTKMYALNYNKFEPIFIVQQVLFFPHSKASKSFFLETQIVDKTKKRLIFVSDQIKLFLNIYLSFPKYLYFVTCCVQLYFISKMLLHVTQNANFFILTFPFGFPVSLVITLFNAFLGSYAMIQFAIVNITFTIVVFTFTLVIFTRLKQANKLINKSNFSEINFRKFASFHTATLKLVTSGNSYFGSCLVYFLIIYIPNNAYMSVQLIRGIYPPTSAFIFSNAHAFEYVYVFGIHALSAAYSTRVHHCSCLLLHWKVRERFQSFLTKLKLANYIEKFHVDSSGKYGITYGNFGLVSYDSLFKVKKCIFKFIFYN